ncbi:hypothetical protein [Methanimicrococcus stummii]|uniref:hypothetical protein n=1 Tax=Methanimicrococcus stummii TaxID=3028294 RepID=UPI00292EC119|nr:hypothetical protein [Methanimicrococcus sp. Es2]
MVCRFACISSFLSHPLAARAWHCYLTVSVCRCYLTACIAGSCHGSTRRARSARTLTIK